MPALMAAIEALLMMRAPAVILHVPRRALGADDHAEEVDAHDAGEVLEVVGQEPLERAPDPRVVEHDVQAAELVDGEVDQCLHLVRIADVGLLEGGGLTDARRRPPGPVPRRRRRSRRSRPRRRATRRSPGRCHPRHRSRSPPSLASSCAFMPRPYGFVAAGASQSPFDRSPVSVPGIPGQTVPAGPLVGASRRGQRSINSVRRASQSEPSHPSSSPSRRATATAFSTHLILTSSMGSAFPTRW